LIAESDREKDEDEDEAEDEDSDERKTRDQRYLYGSYQWSGGISAKRIKRS
jgi:hypothetical protein